MEMPPDRNLFLGVDIGGTRTRALLVDKAGGVRGFGRGGPGNHETVGWDGLTASLQTALDQACRGAGLRIEEVHAAGFGIGGLDWDSQEDDTRQAIAKTGLRCPMRLVNDTVLGLLAGAPEGWGIAVVSGTGCNCWGWNRDRTRIGRVTGGGALMGEGAGAAELMAEAVKAVARAWTRRGPATGLADAFVSCSAPRIFETAAGGDPVAKGLIDWAGTELGEMVNAVVRQLEFQALAFDVVMIGSMFDAGPALTDPMRRKVRTEAPRARFLRLTCPPVVGAAVLALEQGGAAVGDPVKSRLARETAARL
jgi:N-acetylglucosamine kinase-like BadF-type ATPase